MDAALQAMLTETVSHAPYVSQDSYGRPVYAEPIDRVARVDFAVRRFTTAQGEERVSQAVVYLVWNFALDLRDRLTIDGLGSPAMQRINRLRDEAGQQSHYEVFV